MKLGQHQEAFARDVEALLAFAHALGYGVRIGECWRPDEMQRIYVEQGRSKTMQSRHQQKLAIDLHFTKDGRLVYPERIGRFWESLSPENSAGMFWRSFKDAPHFERRAKV